MDGFTPIIAIVVVVVVTISIDIAFGCHGWQ
jgi:hypothetical protein